MSEKRFTLVFLLALLIGAAATYGVYRFINAQRLAAEQLGRVETAPVVVLTREVTEGTELRPNLLTVRHFPVGVIPEGAFPHEDSVVGRVAYTRIYPDEPVIESKLAPLGALPGLEVKIAPGHRAMAVRVSDIVGVTGLIRPESRVDVLVSMRAGNGRDAPPIGKIILQNVRVLSVGTQTERGDPNKPIVSSAVTLEVTPQEAEILTVAQNEGSLSLALRSFGDPDMASTPGATAEQVLAGIPVLKPKPTSRPTRRTTPTQPQAQPATAQSEEPAPYTVQIYRGSRLSEQEFQKDTTAKNDTTRTREKR